MERVKLVKSRSPFVSSFSLFVNMLTNGEMED
jgi:hypothetical protein